jgi:ribosomal protein L7/L12
MSTKAEVAEKEEKQMKEETQGEAKHEAKPEAKKSGTLASKLQKILESIEQLTVLELAQLVKALEEKFGVSAQAAVAVAAPVQGGAQDAGQAAAGEEKTTFQVILASAGDKKINVIKEIRTVTSLGL